MWGANRACLGRSLYRGVWKLPNGGQRQAGLPQAKELMHTKQRYTPRLSVAIAAAGSVADCQ
ncbi:hypothetical protein [Microcoleus sp. B13-B4]|uniref:hypothetical protein n=1 Tax=Microcoleus sp. B13-B4 TaxID=2818651 RepID=UPI002FCE8DEA